MPKKDSKQIEAQIKKLEKDAAMFIGKLESELEFARTKRMTEKHQQDLERQIEQARAAYDGMLAPHRQELHEVLATEQREMEEIKRVIAENAAETKAQIKGQMMQQWIRAGGDLNVFDKAFEEVLYPAEMARRVEHMGVTQRALDEEGKKELLKAAARGMQ